MNFCKTCVSVLIGSVQIVLAFSGGSGTPGDPYRISTQADIVQVNSDLSASYILVNDLDLDGTVYIKAVIAPDNDPSSGFQGTTFTGSFDGRGHSINNLKISSEYADYVGLFGFLDTGGSVTNLGVQSCQIAGDMYVGGIAGRNFGDISDTFSSGNIAGTYHVGGITGINEGLTSYSGSITNCYSTASLYGESDTGGLVGDNYGNIGLSYSTGYINTGEYYYFGGLVGWQSTRYGSVTNSFWDMESSGQLISAAGTGKNTAQMTFAATFTDASWDFVSETVNGDMDLWYMTENSYPRLYWQAGADINYDGKLGVLDFLLFISQWLDSPPAGTRMAGDTFEDGIVNYPDYSVMAYYLQREFNPADLNMDGVVDGLDLKIITANWLASVAGTAGDLNRDGMVDLLDYLVLSKSWLVEE